MYKWLHCVSMAVMVTVIASAAVYPGLAQAKPVFPTKADLYNVTELPVTITEQGGHLLLSDSPEMVPDDGIMYQDTVSGDIRLFFHHVNATKEPKKIVVLLTNNSERAADIIVSNFGLGGPGLDYLDVGKVAQIRYLQHKGVELVEVPAGGTALLEPALNDIVVAPDELVNGIYDFFCKVPIKVTVMMLPTNADPAEFAAKAAVLPTDSQRLRGTFLGKDRLVVPTEIYNSATNGLVGITLADHKLDTFVAGIDATDGSQTFNYGNYGVVYKLFLPTAFEQKYAVYLNPRGGEYAGAMNVKYRRKELRTVGTPADRLFFGVKTVTDLAHLGDFSGGESLWLTFSPPGASNLPVKILLAPATNSQ